MNFYLGSVHNIDERELAKLRAEKKKATECLWCGEENATGADVCSEKCAQEQAYADRMSEDNTPQAQTSACPVCGETNKHVCQRSA